MPGSGIDFNTFIEEKLAENGFRIERITKELMQRRLHDISTVVNDARTEYSEQYGWKKENDEYFLNDLPGKWKFSYFVRDLKDEICMVCINSMLHGNSVHFHAVYVKDGYRNKSLSKFVILKTAHSAIESGVKKLGLYCHKNNHSAFSLYSNIGFKANVATNNADIFMEAESETVRDLCYSMLTNKKKG